MTKKLRNNYKLNDSLTLIFHILPKCYLLKQQILLIKISEDLTHS